MNSELKTDITDGNGTNGLRDFEVGQGTIFALRSILFDQYEIQRLCEDQRGVEKHSFLFCPYKQAYGSNEQLLQNVFPWVKRLTVYLDHIMKVGTCGKS